MKRVILLLRKADIRGENITWIAQSMAMDNA